MRFRGLPRGMTARRGRRTASLAFRIGRLAFAALAGDDLHLTFTLGPSEISRDLGYDHFRLAFQLKLGCMFTMELTVVNDATAPLIFEEALHTYYESRTFTSSLSPV